LPTLDQAKYDTRREGPQDKKNASCGSYLST
jgi:hypothetical protein